MNDDRVKMQQYTCIFLAPNQMRDKKASLHLSYTFKLWLKTPFIYINDINLLMGTHL